jgi:hypothetical protein
VMNTTACGGAVGKINERIRPPPPLLYYYLDSEVRPHCPDEVLSPPPPLLLLPGLGGAAPLPG